jgi:hypothetical protein
VHTECRQRLEGKDSGTPDRTNSKRGRGAAPTGSEECDYVGTVGQMQRERHVTIRSHGVEWVKSAIAATRAANTNEGGRQRSAGMVRGG